MTQLKPPWACDFQFWHRPCKSWGWCRVKEPIHTTLHVKYVHDWHWMGWSVPPRHKNSTPKTGADLTTRSEGSAHTRALEKGTEKQVTILVIRASQSLWPPWQPHNPTPPFSASIKVPVSTCSSDIILSLYFLWNSSDGKWVISSCQHRPKRLSGESFSFVHLLDTGRHPEAPPATPYLPGKRVSEQEQPGQKRLEKEGRFLEEPRMGSGTQNINYSSGTHSWEGKQKRG